MWAHTAQGIAANLFGPSELRTEINGAAVRIEQRTDYPFDLTVGLHIDTDRPVAFRLSLRRPGWAREISVDAKGTRSESGGYLHIDAEWEAGDTVRILFAAEPAVREDLLGRGFVQMGPLVFALPLAGRPIETRQYPLPGFRDLLYDYDDDPGKKSYQLPPEPSFNLVRGDTLTDKPFQKAVQLQGKLFDPKDGVNKSVTLVPMGGAVLRKVSFRMSPDRTRFNDDRGDESCR